MLRIGQGLSSPTASPCNAATATASGAVQPSRMSNRISVPSVMGQVARSGSVRSNQATATSWWMWLLTVSATSRLLRPALHSLVVVQQAHILRGDRPPDGDHRQAPRALLATSAWPDGARAA